MKQKDKGLSSPIHIESMISIAFPNYKKSLHRNGIILAADVGGTKTNLALYEINDGKLITLNEKSFHTKNYNSFAEMALSFYSDKSITIDGLCLGVAGPVVEGKVKGTNFPWQIDSDKISKELKISSVSVINDMEANAYGLAALCEKDLEVIHKGANIAGNAVIISPGTGLGEVGLYWDGTHYHPFASEGGHCDFSPRNTLEIALWEHMHQKYKHVSWERILSGPGIYDTYQFLIQYRKQTEPDWIKQRMSTENPAAVITNVAIEGKDPICRETLDLFTRFLAIESAQLALKMKATGGIYIGGGIVPKIIKGLNKTIFNRGFIQSGRLDELLEMVPVKVILNEKTALLGAAYFGAMALNN
jgi:glucokinase